MARMFQVNEKMSILQWIGSERGGQEVKAGEVTVICREIRAGGEGRGSCGG